MKVLLGFAGLIGVASAHSAMTNFIVNGVSTQDCVRQATSVNPITDLSSDRMACNDVKGNGKTKCKVKGGDQIGMEWRSDPGIPPKDYPLKNGNIPVGVTDDSHKGPCAIYMKKVDDALTATAPGDGWFKLNHDSVDADGVFCTDRLRLGNLPQPGVIPNFIQPGDYLIRAEMLTLNNAGPADRGGAEEPQFYTGCAQITVEGTSGNPYPGVRIPGHVDKRTPGLIFDIWNSKTGKFTDYPKMFGPDPISPAGAGPSPGLNNQPPAGTTLSTTTVPAPPKTSPPANNPDPTPSPTPSPPPTGNNPPPPPANNEPSSPKTTPTPDPSSRGRGRGRGGRPKPTTSSTPQPPAEPYPNDGNTETGGSSVGWRWNRYAYKN